ncbi:MULTISPECIES: glycosyltransferase [unclassified Cedecea]|uniref:glycosyltransferase n=1 Tax=unclassified Cedecea TaxID=2649846 RepID=UPI00301B2B5B
MNFSYFDESNVIRDKIEFDFQDDNNLDALAISFGTDKNFLLGCGVAITSILISNPQHKFSFHIFTDEFSTQDSDEFSILAKRYKIKLTIYIIDSSELNGLPITKNWTKAIYYRFIIFDYFNKKCDRVLYLDSDIVCQHSLDELIHLDLDDNIAAVVADESKEWWEKRANQLRSPAIKNGYFNSGVLLVDPNRWVSQEITKKALALLNDREVQEYISYPDQDIINILLAGHLYFLNIKYNTQFSLNYELKEKVDIPIKTETVFIHYIGPTKPWHAWGNYISSQPFMHAKKQSPWNNKKLLEPVTATQSRYAAKHFSKQKKYLLAMVCWAKYYFYKLQ